MRFLTLDFETVAPRHGDALCPWSDGFRVSAAGFANNFVNPAKPPMYDVRPWPTVENVTYALEQAVKHKARSAPRPDQLGLVGGYFPVVEAGGYVPPAVRAHDVQEA